MKYENVEQLAANFLNLKNGECEKIETRHDELDLWVEFEDNQYVLDWVAFSSIDGTQYDQGRMNFGTALQAAHQVAKIVN